MISALGRPNAREAGEGPGGRKEEAFPGARETLKCDPEQKRGGQGGSGGERQRGGQRGAGAVEAGGEGRGQGGGRGQEVPSPGHSSAGSWVLSQQAATSSWGKPAVFFNSWFNIMRAEQPPKQP